MIILYDTITGETLKLAKRFNIESKQINNYKLEDKKIILISRRLFINEDIAKLKVFLAINIENILGVIVYDNKLFGKEYGNSLEIYSQFSIPILRVWDKIVSDQEIKELEKELKNLVE